MSIQKTIEVNRGEDVTVTLTVDEPITGWALAFALRQEWGDAVPLATLTTGDGIVITDGPGGVADIDIPSLLTDLGPGDYHYAISRVDPGERAVLTEGTFRIKKPRAT